jgi:GNAT superfamily N-acetyltransferase
VTAGDITARVVSGDEAAGQIGELRALYAEVYAQAPYEWGEEHAALFAERFEVQLRQPGFTLAEALDGFRLVGFGFGVTLQPSTPWWRNLTAPMPTEVTTEWTDRTFALVELLVRAPWRRQGIARAMHDMLISDRPEERATLTVLPAASPAQAAYQKWGWQRIAQKRNPLPGSPLFDVMIKPLTPKTNRSVLSAE